MDGIVSYSEKEFHEHRSANITNNGTGLRRLDSTSIFQVVSASGELVTKGDTHYAIIDCNYFDDSLVIPKNSFLFSDNTCYNDSTEKIDPRNLAAILLK